MQAGTTTAGRLPYKDMTAYFVTEFKRLRDGDLVRKTPMPPFESIISYCSLMLVLMFVRSLLLGPHRFSGLTGHRGCVQELLPELIADLQNHIDDDEEKMYGKALMLFYPDSPVRVFAHRVASSGWFEHVILFAIVISSVQLAVRSRVLWTLEGGSTPASAAVSNSSMLTPSWTPPARAG